MKASIDCRTDRCYFLCPLPLSQDEAKELAVKIFGTTIETTIEAIYAPSRELTIKGNWNKRSSRQTAEYKELAKALRENGHINPDWILAQMFFHTLIGYQYRDKTPSGNIVSRNLDDAKIILRSGDCFEIKVPNTLQNKYRFGLVFGYFEHMNPREIVEGMGELEKLREALKEVDTALQYH